MPNAELPPESDLPASTEPAPDARGQLLQRTESQYLSYCGPVPHPVILRQYEDLVPGSAARMIAQADRQTDHRIAIERTVIQSDTERSRLGLKYGFWLSLLSIGGGCVLVGLGHDGAGATIATAAVASLASVFIYGTATRRRELARKAKMVPPPGQSNDSQPETPAHPESPHTHSAQPSV